MSRKTNADMEMDGIDAFRFLIEQGNDGDLGYCHENGKPVVVLTVYESGTRHIEAEQFAVPTDVAMKYVRKCRAACRAKPPKGSDPKDWRARQKVTRVFADALADVARDAKRRAA